MALPSTFHSLTQAVEFYYEELQAYVQQRTGSASLAEDVVQETWIRAHSTQMTMPSNPRAYLYRMAGNLAIDVLRKQKSQQQFENQPSLCENGDAEPLSASPALEEVIASQQELDILMDAVQALPDKCREVFLLYRGKGWTMREIASALNIADKTVEKHIAKAMIFCRKQLRKAGRDI